MLLERGWKSIYKRHNIGRSNQKRTYREEYIVEKTKGQV